MLSGQPAESAVTHVEIVSLNFRLLSVSSNLYLGCATFDISHVMVVERATLVSGVPETVCSQAPRRKSEEVEVTQWEYQIDISHALHVCTVADTFEFPGLIKCSPSY